MSDYEMLRSSGLLDDLVKRSLIVPHEVADVAPATREGALVLRPEVVPLVSYPAEWSFSQLRDAAILTLDIQLAALARGMTLKDASAYNVLFRASRPVFIDVLSLVKRNPREPWVAYGQFCRHFLAPLALMSTRDARLGALMRTTVDGIPIELAAKLLPFAKKLRPSLMMHLALHAKAERRGSRMTSTTRPELSDAGIEGIVRSLRNAVEALDEPQDGTTWESYDPEASYSPEALAAKRRIVARMLSATEARRAVDLGGNTGTYSRLAASMGMDAICVDSDPGAVNACHRLSQGTRVHALLADIANPSPGGGWAGQERAALLPRLRADVVIALALVHHLVIGSGATLRMVVDLLADLAPTAIAEFVPKDDPQAREMLAIREDVFPDYEEKAFEDALLARFEIVEREALPSSKRVLFLLRRRPS